MVWHVKGNFENIEIKCYHGNVRRIDVFLNKKEEKELERCLIIQIVFLMVN
jgi:hypothetical protein